MAKRKSHEISVEDNPEWVSAPPRGTAPKPPVETKIAELPFSEIQWQDFERLCREVATRDGAVEHVLAYGEHGQAQYGIDLLVRLKDGGYEVWQTKRYRKMKPTDVRDAVQLFLDHRWAEKARKFVLAVACPLRSTGVVEAIEVARDTLKGRGKDFEPLDSDGLSARLRTEPEIVDDFFSRAWALAFCPPEAQERLTRRLSRLDVPALRRRLLEWFTSWVATVDPGLPLADLGSRGAMASAIPLGRRYVRPDVLVRIPEQREENRAAKSVASDPAVAQVSDMAAGASPLRRRKIVARDERVDLTRFLRGESRVLISADAGMGKTTLLRVLALDLLAEKPKSALWQEMAEATLPVWVPFALWARMAEDADTPPPLEDAVHAFFVAHSEPDLATQIRAAIQGGRVVLLVDGLDEAVNETAARTVASMLATQVEARNLPVLATSRPHGLVASSGMPASWSRVELAPLSEEQRDALATLWFEALAVAEGGRSATKAKKKRARGRAVALAEALRRNPGIHQLAQTPLFLLALLQLHRQSQELPRSRFAAVGKIIEQLIEHQPRRRASAAMDTKSPDLQPRQRDRVLGAFAFALQAGELTAPINDAALEEEAVAMAAALLLSRQPDLGADRAEETARSLFSFAEERAGLLVKRATGAVGFMHLSLQEFLAARHLTQRPFDERLGFVRAHVGQSRWRAPILYLLHLEDNERQVGELLRAIQDAPANNARERSMRHALLSEAVFADFDHDLEVVRDLARELMNEAEAVGHGEARRRTLSSTVDGLFSESVSDLCATRLSRWLPDRHGYARAGVLRALPEWPGEAHAACKPILLRSLSSEQESVRWAAAEALPRLRIDANLLQDEIAELIRRPANVEAMASGLRAFSTEWASAEQAGRFAAATRISVDPSIALEAIRVRAKRKETDAADFTRFFRMRFARDSTFEFEERALVEHFAASDRDAFVERLTTCLSQWHGGSSEARSLVGALMLCDADHPLVEKTLLQLFEHDFNFRSLVGERFPADKIRWTPKLRAKAQAYANQENAHFHDFELYWLAKVLPESWLKARIIENLRHEMGSHFWSAKALIECWGAQDDEVQKALLTAAEKGGEATAGIAAQLPEVMEDKARCRFLLTECLSAGPQRSDFVVAGLRRLGLGHDRGVFEKCWNAGPRIRAGGLFKDLWRDQIIRTFSHEASVRELAAGELRQRFGQVAAVAEAYGADPSMRAATLRAVDVLEATGRDIVVTQLQGAAFVNEQARDLLSVCWDDDDAGVAAEATVAWTSVAKSQEAVVDADVERLRQGLTMQGHDFDQRRATAVIGLAIVGRIDVFVDATEIKGQPLKVNLARPSYREDDRYLRWMLLHWPEFLKKLGGVEKVVERLELSPEALLEAVTPDMAHAGELYRLLMDRAPEYRHVRKHSILEALARFEPKGAKLRQEMREWLVGNDHGEYWGGLVAAEIFAEHFADDVALRADILDAVDTNDFAVAALAEYMLRHDDPEVRTALGEKTLRKSFDFPVALKLFSALSSPERLIGVLEDTLGKLPRNIYTLHLRRWTPAVIRRVERDPALRGALTLKVGGGQPSMQVTATALLSAGGALSDDFRGRAEAEIVRQHELEVPDSGFDLLEQRYRLVGEALETAAR